MSSYDPRTFYLDPGETAYSDAHEHAHRRQHARQGLLWRLWWRFQGIAFLGYWLRILVEAEATCMALSELYRLGVLERGDVAEAAAGFGSYLRALVRF